jgi:hypothetical protein
VLAARALSLLLLVGILAEDIGSVVCTLDMDKGARQHAAKQGICVRAVSENLVSFASGDGGHVQVRKVQEVVLALGPEGVLVRRSGALRGHIQRSCDQHLIAKVGADNKAQDLMRLQTRAECKINRVIDRASDADAGQVALLSPLAHIVPCCSAGGQ